MFISIVIDYFFGEVMSELDILKSNIKQLSAHCHNMIKSGHIGSAVSDTVDKLVESSLTIIAGLEKAKATPPPPKIEYIPVEPKTEPKIYPRKKKVRKYD